MHTRWIFATHTDVMLIFQQRTIFPRAAMRYGIFFLHFVQLIRFRIIRMTCGCRKTWKCLRKLTIDNSGENWCDDKLEFVALMWRVNCRARRRRPLAVFCVPFPCHYCVYWINNLDLNIYLGLYTLQQSCELHSLRFLLRRAEVVTPYQDRKRSSEEFFEFFPDASATER